MYVEVSQVLWEYSGEFRSLRELGTHNNPETLCCEALDFLVLGLHIRTYVIKINEIRCEKCL